MATNECVKDLDSLKLRAQDIGLVPADVCVPVFNDNQAAVDWAASVTTKGIKHLNLRENQVRERHHAGQVSVTHIPGVINPSDIFTKEMKDSAHFRRLRDSIMVAKGALSRFQRPIPSELVRSEKILPYYQLGSPLPFQPSVSRVSFPATSHVIRHSRLGLPCQGGVGTKFQVEARDAYRLAVAGR